MLPSPPEGLRHWRADDADALRGAWSDAAITRFNPPPEHLDADAWIAGVEQRWSNRLALDLVIDADGAVAGEVGLRNFTPDPRRAELGVWVGERFRRQGYARRAVDTLVRWAIAPAQNPNWPTDLPAHGHGSTPEPGLGVGLGLVQVWARTDTGNGAAHALFDGLGWQRLGARAGNTIWSATRAVLG